MSDPYDRAVEILATTPTVLRAYVQGSGSADVARVMHHMLRIETALLNRRVQLMVEQENPDFPSPEPATDERSVDEKLAEWERARAENLAMIRGLRPDQLGRGGKHSRWGAVTVREQVTEWAYHDVDHLRELLELAQVELHPGIGAYRGIYPTPGTPATV